MDTGERLNEAARRQWVALGDPEPKTMGEPGGVPELMDGYGEEALRYMAIMGIDDHDAYLEWLQTQVTVMVIQMGAAVVLAPVSCMASALTAGIGVGYQLALLREVEA